MKHAKHIQETRRHTTLPFIWSIPTVVITITDPGTWLAVAILTVELTTGARSVRTIGFIWNVWPYAIVCSITEPLSVYTFPALLALEVLRWTCHSTWWNKTEGWKLGAERQTSTPGGIGMTIFLNHPRACLWNVEWVLWKCLITEAIVSTDIGPITMCTDPGKQK